MPSSINDDDLPFIDFGMVQEFTVMECSGVERIGPLTRLTFTIPARIDNQSRRVVVAKLLVPTEMIPAIAAQIAGPGKSPPRFGDEATLQ
jgi:hypothetical protein